MDKKIVEEKKRSTEEKMRIIERIEELKAKCGMVKSLSTFDNVNTNLTKKQFSPLIIRKYNILSGWPMYVGIICDLSLSDLDIVVNAAVNLYKDEGLLDGQSGNDIQTMRNLTGYVSSTIELWYNTQKENSVEGIGILLYVDKCAIASMYGDMMNHNACRAEFYSILNMLPHI